MKRFCIIASLTLLYTITSYSMEVATQKVTAAKALALGIHFMSIGDTKEALEKFLLASNSGNDEERAEALKCIKLLFDSNAIKNSGVLTTPPQEAQRTSKQPATGELAQQTEQKPLTYAEMVAEKFFEDERRAQAKFIADQPRVAAKLAREKALTEEKAQKEAEKLAREKVLSQVKLQQAQQYAEERVQAYQEANTIYLKALAGKTNNDRVAKLSAERDQASNVADNARREVERLTAEWLKYQ